MSQDKYKSYDRIHKYKNPSDIEKSKIKTETERYKKNTKQIKKIGRQIINNYENMDESMLEMYDAYINEAEQDRKTAKGHKKRLKALNKRKDFN